MGRAPERLPETVRGFRGGFVVTRSPAHGGMSIGAELPFPSVYGGAWSPDGSRWMVWGGTAPQEDAVDIRAVRRPVFWAIGAVDFGVRATGAVSGWSDDSLSIGSVVSAAWSPDGKLVAIACRGTRASGRGGAECIVLNARGHLLARRRFNDLRSVSPGSDSRSWCLATDRDVYRWTPPAAPDALSIPSRVSTMSDGDLEITEAAWNRAKGKFAVVWRDGSGDSSWFAGVFGSNGKLDRRALRHEPRVRSLRWTSDGSRLIWIEPIPRSFIFHRHEFPIHTDALFVATPGYEPRRMLDVALLWPAYRPEDYVAISDRPTIGAFAWFGDGAVVLVERGFGAGAEVWWASDRGEPQRIDRGPWEGPVWAGTETHRTPRGNVSGGP